MSILLVIHMIPSLILISFFGISYSQVDNTEDVLTIVANVSEKPYDKYSNVEYYKADLRILDKNGSEVCIHNLCNYTRLDPELKITDEYDNLELQIGEPFKINRTTNQGNTSYTVSDTLDVYITEETFDIIRRSNQTTVLFTSEGQIGEQYFSEGE